jgi:glycosyltransferase involved in cell wall biosynthesis
MKVLFLTFWYPTNANPGKGVFIKEHANAIKKSGIDISVLFINFCYSNNLLKIKIESCLDEGGLDTNIITISSRFYKILYANPVLLFYLLVKTIQKEIIDPLRPSVIHANVIFPAGIFGYLLSNTTQLPLIITEHWSKIRLFFRRNFNKHLAKKALNHSLVITTVSEFLKNELLEIIDIHNKVTVVPNVVSHEFFYKPKSPRTDYLVFTSIATWEHPKKPDLIIYALEKFAESTSKQIVLNLVGKGSAIEKIFQNKNERRIVINILGEIPKHKIPDILQSSDFFIHASEIETFSVVIAEALMTGTPVIASDVGAVPELVNQTNGILCDNTEEDWCNKIHKLNDLTFDNFQIAANMEEKFTPEKIGNSFNELYKKFLKQ